MRIIAGSFGGRKLKVPRGNSVRPTSDRVKGAIFSMLGDFIRQKRVCDLFSGSGALGIESLSRGASFCSFIEKDREALSHIKQNLEMLTKGASTPSLDYQILHKDALLFLDRVDKKYNLFFLDPPYHKQLYMPVLKKILKNKLLEPGGLIVVEHQREKDTHCLQMDLLAHLSDQKLSLLKERCYSDTVIKILEFKE